MKVSIITVTYNAEKTLLETINSVKSQSYDDIEYIIIDGGSTDGTLKIIKSNSDVINKWVSEPDYGLYHAMNKGIKFAKGDIIGFLNADDFYTYEHVISDVVSLFSQEGVDATYANLEIVKKNNINKVIRYWRAGYHNTNSFFYGWMPPHPTVFLKKYIYEKYGDFNLDLGSASDYEILLRFFHKNNLSAKYLDKTIIKMRSGGISNKSIFNRIKANRYDKKAWLINDLKPKIYTHILKPIRKIGQYLSSLINSK
jgi:glycosyltransferase involved in cell wall biosynthesis